MSISINIDSVVGRGASRIAYDGVVLEASASHPFRPNDQVVVKVLKGEFYNQGYRLSDLDFTAHQHADSLAQEFTRRGVVRIQGNVVAVLFQGTYLWTFPAQVARPNGTVVIVEGEQGLVERKLLLPFQKFNSNTGWTAGNECADFFSHWTYYYTNRRELVCDLQGVASLGTHSLTFNSQVYTHYLFLTDPAILSAEQKWGPSDLGQAGIDRWFSLHRCNSLCVSCGLQNTLPQPRATQVAPPCRETGYVDPKTKQACELQ